MKTAASTSQRRLARRAPAPMALEPRVMFDGAAVDTAAAAVAAAERAAQEAAAKESAANAERQNQVTQTAQATQAAQATEADKAVGETARSGGPRLIALGDPSANGGRREIVFVDSAVPGWQTLVSSMHAGLEIVLLDSSRDGVLQIADYLQGRTDIDAIHLVSHGESGMAVLGTAHLDHTTIGAYQGALSAIGAALNPGADLLLYGCDIAKDSGGLSFIGELSQATGADVAASTDTTGASARGGNWTLEARTGAIETAALLRPDALDAYADTLALPGAHTGSTATGIFLGGNYIELGIRTGDQIGKFGTNDKPGNFAGRKDSLPGIGMVGDADGFGTGADLRIDYFLPGTPEEGFYAGYKIGGVATEGKNFGQTVVDQSSGDTLSAKVTGTIGGNLKVEQVISFNKDDRFFKNTVTLTNVSGSILDAVRFMRSFDPDNTEDIAGASGFTTTQTIERSFQAGDSVAVVSARSAVGDAYYTAAGNKQATILYYSSDNRARVSYGTSGLAPAAGIYDSNVYSSVPAKGSTLTADSYISIAFDVGTLAVGQSVTFTYYTSLDNRDIATILSEIASADNKAFTPIPEDPTSNPGQAVSTVFGSPIAVTSVDNTHGTWQYSSDGTTWNNFSNTTGSVVNIASSARLLSNTDLVRFVPDADWNGTAKLSYRTWDGGGYTSGGTADASGTGGGHFSANAADANLTVTPVNDPPVITSGSSATVPENISTSTVVYQATAYDVDVGDTLTYGLSGTDASAFNINASTGAVTFKASPDFETKSSYTFNVTVSDGTATVTKAVTITITDVNEPPVFTSGGSASVLENVAPGTVVYHATATDPDAGTTLTYSLSGADAALLDIDAHTGVVTIKGSPDYETKSSYSFNVVVSDGELSATKAVVLNIINVNEAPILSSGPDVTYKENAANTPVLVAPGITLSDDLFNGNLGGSVLTVNITNGQAGDQLTLRNEGTGPGQVGFSINQSTGAITYGGVVVGVFSSTNEGKSITITFASSVPPVVNPANVTRQAVEAVMKNLQFFNTSQNPVVGDRNLHLSLNDGGGTANGGVAVGSVDYTVHVEPTNNAPTDIVFGNSAGNGAWGTTNVAPGHNLVTGLGHPTVTPGENADGRYTNADFGNILIPIGDDGFTAINVSDVFPDGFNFCGKTYTGGQFYVGWNGYVTFGQGMTSYTPSGISQSTVPIIAPMFLDFDTRGGKSTANWGADGGNSTGSNRIYVAKDPVNKVVTITFDDVGEYSNRTNVANAFQIRLWDKGNGDFDIEFRYEQVGWAQHGAWTSAGWSAGDRKTYSEIEGSMTSQMSNLASMSNIGQAGVFLWQVRDGGVRTAGVAVTENSPPGTVITPLSTADVDDTNFTYQIKRADGTYGDSDGYFKVVKNAAGTWELQVAPGANFDYETAQSHTVTLRVTDSGGGEGPGHELSFEKTFTIPVIDVNEAPSAISLSGHTVVENSAGGTIIGTLGTTDQDAGDAHTYSIVGGDMDKFAISGNRLIVKPGANIDYETARTHTVTIRTTDKGGLTFDQTFVIDVENVYEPVWFDSNGARNSYTEKAAPTIIDGNIRLLAPENNFNGGYLQVALNGNGEATDKLTVVGNADNLINISGNNVTYNGTVIGTIDATENGLGGQPLRIRLNGAANVESVQALARSIGFSSTSNNPSAAQRTIQFTLSDSISQATKQAHMDVVPVNDPPVAGLPGTAMVTERTNADPSATTYIRGLSVTDVDETGVMTVVLSSRDLGGGNRYGSFTLDTTIAGGLRATDITGNGTGQVTLRGTLAQINATLGASNGVAYTPGLARDSVETGNDRLTLSVTDSGGLNATRSGDILVIPGAPTAHSQNYVAEEDSRAISVDLSRLVVDLNLTNAHYFLGTPVPGMPDLMKNFGPDEAILDGNGNLAGYRLAHGNLMLQPGTTLDQGKFVYTPDPDWNGFETFHYYFQNSQQSSEMAQIRIFITPVNDAPVNVTPPALSGDLREDGTLRQNGTVTGHGTWNDVDTPLSELTYRYQWQIADDASGTNLRDIDGATLAQYKVSGADIGKFVRIKVIANDGELDSQPAYSAFKQVTNADPVLANPPVLPAATESVPFNVTLPANTFTDSDGDTLTYRATRADGSPLPTWLHFDPATRTFSGTPEGGDIGDLSIKVTATDGGYHPASATFTLRVVGVPPVRPEAPATPGGGGQPGGTPPTHPGTTGVPPGLPGVPGDGPGHPGIPGTGGGTGGHPGEPSTIPGSPGGLPPVIELPGHGGIPGYNPPATTGGIPGERPGGGGGLGGETGTGTGTSTGTGAGSNAGTGTGAGNGRGQNESGGNGQGSNGSAGSSASAGNRTVAGLGNQEGLTRAEGFQILVRSGNESDTQSLRPGRTLDDQDLPINKLFKVSVPVDAFVHTKTDAVITLHATLSDGTPLPPWVEFDGGKGVFRGTPPLGYEGDLEVVITARDSNGNVATQRFRIRVGDATVGKAALSEQLRSAGSHARHAERLNLVKLARAATVAKRAA
ncbi:DUF4347 domain-containing protein [Oryzomicrobium sp.]|uniref:DUF4347 domain-containing protein n=1 Tax=Oryzomicrobium sp. TaxID=1911578 RepID=UPI002FE4170F